MLDLRDHKVSYIIATPEPSHRGYSLLCERYTSVTHSLGYNDLEIFSSDPNHNYGTSFITYCNEDNNNLRMNALKIMTDFKLENIVVKYLGEDLPKLVLKDGSERLLEIQYYEATNFDRTYVLHNGVSFSFKPIKRYYFPTKKEDFKKNMVVELYHDTKWVEYVVEDVDTEWEELYQIFTKYEKIRIHRE